ncbi:hypothetical protein WJX79_002330 [Trebouxia sp. C0005]
MVPDAHPHRLTASPAKWALGRGLLIVVKAGGKTAGQGCWVVWECWRQGVQWCGWSTQLCAVRGVLAVLHISDWDEVMKT